MVPRTRLEDEHYKTEGIAVVSCMGQMHRHQTGRGDATHCTGRRRRRRATQGEDTVGDALRKLTVTGIYVSGVFTNSEPSTCDGFSTK